MVKTAKPGITPKPQVMKWLKGTGAVGNVTVEYDSALRSPQAEALFKKMAKTLLNHQLPDEGYLLQVNPRGAFLLAKDKHGETYGRQTLAQLKLENGRYPLALIADWPQQAWRGLHVLDSGPGSLPQLKTLIHEVLSPNRCNILIYEIDYNYAFKTHPEIKADDSGAWTKDQVRELVQAGRDEGIKVIPEINCLGHQSWLFPPGALLKAHPEFEEPPDGSTPETDLKSKDFYCRSWCPLHPKLNPLMFDLFGELIDAFQTDTFHVGMDEVFVLASKKCPRCHDKNTADLFAGQVLAFHDFFLSKGVTMMMWGDRLLNHTSMGYSEWDASANGTDAAIDRIPKDIVLCDWHYDYNPPTAYPSVKYFTDKGYRVWPTVYKNLDASEKFIDEAAKVGSLNMMGTLASLWYPGGEMLDALRTDSAAVTTSDGEKRERTPIAKTAVADFLYMWNPVR